MITQMSMNSAIFEMMLGPLLVMLVFAHVVIATAAVMMSLSQMMRLASLLANQMSNVFDMLDPSLDPVVARLLALPVARLAQRPVGVASAATSGCALGASVQRLAGNVAQTRMVGACVLHLAN